MQSILKKSMRTYYGVGQLNHKLRRPILAIGIFDGVHLGHQYIIKKIVKKAKSINGTSVILTFYPHPYHILRPREYLPLLISLEHRLKLIADLGIDVCIVQEFTEKFSQTNKVAFIKNILFKKIEPLEIFVGKDFTFGKKRSGNVNFLEGLSNKYGYKTEEISPVVIAGKRISSTFIRRLIRQGKLNLASKFLGRPVSIFGKIVKGSARGRMLGFPTANIDYNHEILPPTGVYAVKLNLVKEEFFGVANIGFRPSFKRTDKQKKVIAEVHIFDFSKNIYGKFAEMEFIKRIRLEKRFKDKSNLICQIEKDLQKTRQFFKI